MSHRLNDETLPRETDPLLDRTQSNESHTSDKSTNDKHDTTSPPGGCLAWLRLPTFTTINPRYRYLPLVGCLIILFNEAEFFFKQAATMRAVESLFCIEYWNDHDPPLPARLGKKIPERLCKADVIEKQVAQAWAWVMLARMICAIIGAIPLGRLADTKGRWPVLVMHKVSVVVTALWQLVVCKSSAASTYEDAKALMQAIPRRSRLSQTSNMEHLLWRPRSPLWGKFRPQLGIHLDFLYGCHA